MCLNGNFDTFCFDFTNITEVAVRKYFSPPVRGWTLVRGTMAERLWCPVSPHFPQCKGFILGLLGSQEPPRFAIPSVGQLASQMGPDQALHKAKKRGFINLFPPGTKTAAGISLTFGNLGLGGVHPALIAPH